MVSRFLAHSNRKRAVSTPNSVSDPCSDSRARHRSANHFDLVALGRDDKQYRYKYYDGASWQPSVSGWYERPGVSFDSVPSVISWGPNRLDIFGVSLDDKLLHQAWTGYDWYPGVEIWETLSGGDDDDDDGDGDDGNDDEAEGSYDGRPSIEVELRY